MQNGIALNVKLVAYPQRPGLEIMQPVIKAQLEALGINVTSILTSGSSWDQLNQIIADKNFDLLMWAQNTLPAGDPLWFLNTFFRSDGGSNYSGLQSATVDGLLDSLSIAEQHAARVVAAKEAQAAILAEVPVSNLITPAWHVGLSDRMSEYDPWGSDYFVIREDLHKVGSKCKQLDIDFIMLEGDATIEAIEDDIRSDLAKIGINVRPRALNKTEFNDAMQSGDFHMCFSETWGPHMIHIHTQSHGHRQMRLTTQPSWACLSQSRMMN